MLCVAATAFYEEEHLWLLWSTMDHALRDMEPRFKFRLFVALIVVISIRCAPDKGWNAPRRSKRSAALSR